MFGLSFRCLIKIQRCGWQIEEPTDDEIIMQLNKAGTGNMIYIYQCSIKINAVLNENDFEMLTALRNELKKNRSWYETIILHQIKEI